MGERMGRRPPNIEGMYTLKVDNITYRTTEDELARVFDRYGEIGDIYIPKDFMGGGNKGFGFVRFYSRRDAEKGMEKCDGKMVDGREIIVSEALQPRTTRWGGGPAWRGPPPPMWGPTPWDRRSRSRSRDRDRRRRRSRSRSRDRRRRSRSGSRSRKRRRRSKSRSSSKSSKSSRSGSRSKSGSKSKSRSRSGSKEKSKSRSKSRSKSKERSRSPSKERSRSKSGSREGSPKKEESSPVKEEANSGGE